MASVLVGGMADRYEIEFTRQAYGHLKAVRRFDRNTILDAVKEQLTYAPTEETQNRKLLRDNPLADWELRVGQHRVFYDVDTDNRRVRILAVGVKDRNKLTIGRKEVVL
jgi:mRNA-degrading endonuclease RelE of RelBE toxin-antitoxin system